MISVNPGRLAWWQALAAFVAGAGLLVWLLRSRAVWVGGGAAAHAWT